MEYELNAEATERFNQWFRAVAKPNVRIEAVLPELLDVFAAREPDEDLSYELGSRYTISGRPEIFTASRDEIVAIPGTEVQQ